MDDLEVKNSNDENGQHKEILRTEDIQVADDFTFSKFLLSDKLLKSLHRLNFQKPSPIQLKVIPLAKCCLDMIIQAKSGTGKTLAFAICILETFNEDLKFPQSLIVVPTREIAVQIVNVLNDLGRNVKHFRACEFIGGTEVANDRKNIQSAKVVVGTPGRILHLVNNEIFNISCLKSLVLDEADKLLENGQMAKDVTKILNLMHKKIQIIATTATVTDHLEKIMKKVMKNPIGITPKHEIPVLLGIKQFVKVLPRENDNILLMNSKIEQLHKIFTRITFKQCLLFTDSQSKTESYGNYLNKRGWKNEVINGAQDQSQRLRILDKLVNFKCRILITTDLMARGIDIENINLIINLDLPYDCFTYLHRIGRAGRFGTHGLAITFVNGEESLEKFQKLLGDIGGDSLKALKYPDESIQYDFWNFEEKDDKSLDSISGVMKNGDDKVNGSTDRDGEITMNNLALLEITRKLVDDTSKQREAFDLNAIIADYERNQTEDVASKPVTNGAKTNDVSLKSIANGEILLGITLKPLAKNEASVDVLTTNRKASVDLEDDDIFLKTIKELELYNDENVESFEREINDDKIGDSSTTETKQNAEPKEDKRHVIFKKPAMVDEGDELSLESSDDESSVQDEETENDNEEFESEVNNSEEYFDDRNSYHQEPFNQYSNTHQENYDSYQNYVANNYAQWRNIFHFQLANIQNYIESNPK